MKSIAFSTSFSRPQKPYVYGTSFFPCLSCPVTVKRRKRAHLRARIAMGWRPAGLLQDAVREKTVQMDEYAEMISRRPDHPINLRLGFFAQEPSHRFTHALRRCDGTLAVVPVLKRVEMGRDYNLRAVAPLDNIGEDARFLSLVGADALIIDTDSPRSMVDIDDFVRITKALRTSSLDAGIPCARSDLIVHPVQIAEAAETGAAAVVIIAAAALTDLVELVNSCTIMGIEPIVECHTELERDFAIEMGATILYLTNYDRSTDRMVPGRAEELRSDIPNWILTIGGGGMQTARDCWSLLDAGFNAVALGKSMLETRRKEGFIKEIRSEKSLTLDPFAGRFDNPFMTESDAL